MWRGGDAKQASAEFGHDGIPAVLKLLGAKPEDTFNCDESVVIFGAQPTSTLAPTIVASTKQVLDPLTVQFFINLTGTERIRLLM